MTHPYDKPFSIENFKELFENSEAKKYLEDDVLAQINDAIELEDAELLQGLFPTLVNLYNTTHGIMDDFLAKKDELMDSFNNECIDVKKRYVEEPQKKKRERAEKAEQKAAENILQKIK